MLIERQADREVFRVPWPESGQAWSFSETSLSGFYTARVGSSKRTCHIHSKYWTRRKAILNQSRRQTLGDAFQVRTIEELKQQDAGEDRRHPAAAAALAPRYTARVRADRIMAAPPLQLPPFKRGGRGGVN